MGDKELFSIDDLFEPLKGDHQELSAPFYNQVEEPSNLEASESLKRSLPELIEHFQNRSPAQTPSFDTEHAQDFHRAFDYRQRSEHVNKPEIIQILEKEWPSSRGRSIDQIGCFLENHEFTNFNQLAAGFSSVVLIGQHAPTQEDRIIRIAPSPKYTNPHGLHTLLDPQAWTRPNCALLPQAELEHDINGLIMLEVLPILEYESMGDHKNRIFRDLLRHLTRDTVISVGDFSGDDEIAYLPESRTPLLGDSHYIEYWSPSYEPNDADTQELHTAIKERAEKLNLPPPLTWITNSGSFAQHEECAPIPMPNV